MVLDTITFVSYRWNRLQICSVNQNWGKILFNALEYIFKNKDKKYFVHMFLQEFRSRFSWGSDVSNFIESNQKIAPSCCCLLGNDTKNWFLSNCSRSTYRVHFEKTSLFVEYDYEQQTSTSLWSVRVRKWFKKCFSRTHFKKLMKFRKFIEIFCCCMTRLRFKK